MIKRKDRARGAKVVFGSGRHTGKPTGSAEGVHSHIIVNKKAAKARPGTQGPQNKFGFQGSNPYGSNPSGGANVIKFRSLSTKAAPQGPTVTGSNSSGGAQKSVPDHAHWHRFKDGHIERGVATLQDNKSIIEHIQKLGPDHVAVGRALKYVIGEEEGEGLVQDWGKHGVQVKTGENEPVNLFWHEIAEIDAPPKKKRRTATNKNGAKPITRGIWQRLGSLLTEVKRRATQGS